MKIFRQVSDLKTQAFSPKILKYNTIFSVGKSKKKMPEIYFVLEKNGFFTKKWLKNSIFHIKNPDFPSKMQHIFISGFDKDEHMIPYVVICYEWMGQPHPLTVYEDQTEKQAFEQMTWKVRSCLCWRKPRKFEFFVWKNVKISKNLPLKTAETSIFDLKNLKKCKILFKKSSKRAWKNLHLRVKNLWKCSKFSFKRG